MRRAPSGGARTVRLEVARGGDVVYGEGDRAAPSAVLGRAEEAFGDGHLVSYLPGVAGCLTRRVAWAVGGFFFTIEDHPGRGGSHGSSIAGSSARATFSRVKNLPKKSKKKKKKKKKCC